MDLLSMAVAREREQRRSKWSSDLLRAGLIGASEADKGGGVRSAQDWTRKNPRCPDLLHEVVIKPSDAGKGGGEMSAQSGKREPSTARSPALGLDQSYEVERQPHLSSWRKIMKAESRQPHQSSWR